MPLPVSHRDGVYVYDMQYGHGEGTPYPFPACIASLRRNPATALPVPRGCASPNSAALGLTWR